MKPPSAYAKRQASADKPSTGFRDEFLSEEDLDLRNLTDEELEAYWNLWLEQAQTSNDLDADEYSHGVFTHVP